MGASDKIRSAFQSKLDQGLAMGHSKYGERITEAMVAFEKTHGKPMPEMRQALLANALEQYSMRLKQSNLSEQFIKEASESVGDVTNPISLMYALISILVPNFAYEDAAGVQPMPTEESPIFFQQLTANTARNGVAKGAQLLGSGNWNTNNLYTSNRNKEAIVGAASPWTLAPAVGGSALVGGIVPGSVKVKTDTILLKDNKLGGFTVVSGTCTLGAATINYTTGAISIATSVGSLTGAIVDYRYDLDAYDPAQVLYEWATMPMKAHSKRLRSIYGLENYYAAKKVLPGMDIDTAMSTAVAGYLNKEVSCGVFENMLDEASSISTWSKALPAGVSWAFHRLSILETMVKASNKIRKDIARGAGNVIVAGSDWMNIIETLGTDLWKPASYGKEPIGPYNAGTLAGKFTIIKNQQLADDTGFMAYKGDDTDASYMVGAFIPLYDTDPIALDDLKVRRGMGTSIGETLLFSNSIIELNVVA